MMTTKSKSILIILCTLLLGTLVGLLLGGAIREWKKADFRRMPRRERFHHSMERIIQPSKEQKAAIDKILKTRYGQIRELREKYEEEIFTIYDSLRTDLDALLTDEQKERLEKRLSSGPQNLFEDRLDQVAIDLRLSHEQKEKLKAAVAKYIKPMHRPEGMSERNFRESRRSMRGNWNKFREEVQTILTPEQFEEFKKTNRRLFFKGYPRMGMEFPPPHDGDRPPPPPDEGMMPPPFPDNGDNL